MIVILVVVAVLAAVRLALPSVLRSQINARLAKVEDFGGGVGAVHVALWRGGYALRSVRIVKKAAGETYPFVSARNIDFSLAWRELIHGKIVSDIVIEDARINFVKNATPETSQLEVSKSWQQVIEDIFPIDITRLEIRGGRVHFVDRTVTPVVDIYVENLEFYATGLRNRPSQKKTEEFPAHMRLIGTSIGGGKLLFLCDADPLADQSHFEAHGQIEQVTLPAMNPFLKTYGGLEVKAGDFKLYAEMAARDGRYQGYVKPFFGHIKFTDITQNDLSLPQKVWQTMASGLVELFKNKSQDQLAMRVPFAGEFGHTQVGTWRTITSMLHNGFIHALPATLEHTIRSAEIKPASEPAPTPASAAATAAR